MLENNKFKEQNWFKKKYLIPIVYIIAMIIFLIGSFIINLPVLFLISIYALTISTITVQYDHIILNSLTKPLTFTYLFAFLQDIYDLNWLFAIFHIGTVVSCFLIIKRKQTSLILMIFMSILYALWIYAIKMYLYFPFYQCVFFICYSTHQALVVAITGIVSSFILSIEEIKRFLNRKT